MAGRQDASRGGEVLSRSAAVWRAHCFSHQRRTFARQFGYVLYGFSLSNKVCTFAVAGRLSGLRSDPLALH